MKIQQCFLAACALLAPVFGEEPVAPILVSDAAEPGVRGASPEIVPGLGAGAAKTLTVTVVSAQDLEGEDTIGTSDMYVEVQVWKDVSWGKDTPIGTQSTSVVESLNPTWNESFEFPVMDGDNDYVIFTVYDQDVGSDDKVGDCRIDLEDVDLSATPTTITEVVDSHWTSKDEKLTVALSLA